MRFISTKNIQFTRNLSGYEKKKARKELYDKIIRVDHAGEYGADRIYAGQLAVLGKTKAGPIIEHMWEQEKEHLKVFSELIPKHRVRPTVLLPVWNVAGYALGMGTALLGKEAAMACTVAVEESITEHYNYQLRELVNSDDAEEHKELMETIKWIRDEEMEHHDTGLEHDALNAPFYSALKNVIQVGCKVAIYASERI